MSNNPFSFVSRGLLCSALFYIYIFATIETSTKNENIPSIPVFPAENRGLLHQPKQPLVRHRADFQRQTSTEIISKAYNETFVHLGSCTKNETMRTCLAKIEKTADDHKWPWWFQTMLRDGERSGLNGGWHNLRITNPPMRLCVIEKIATKQWRKLQCLLNNGNTTTRTARTCQPEKNKEPPVDAPRIVFTRDPLERFLSAFIDKCVSSPNRLHQKHCEPNPVYRDEDNKLVDIFLNDRRRFFEAYVDTFPLKWNVHFFPQSLYCRGLYRHIQDYDYVGHMGPSFHDDLYNFGQTHGNGSSLAQAVDRVFDVTKHRNGSKENIGVETLAASHVEEYYTPRTVKRVLEYMAIDYVMLNLPVPDWAEKMLQRDPSLQII